MSDITKSGVSDITREDAAALTTVSFAELARLAEDNKFKELFTVLRDDEKAKLENRPMIITRVEFKKDGDYGGDYVAVWGKAAPMGSKKELDFVFADGGSGVCSELKGIAAANAGSVPVPMLVPGGLRASRYTKEIDGKPTPCCTFYLNGNED